MSLTAASGGLVLGATSASEQRTAPPSVASVYLVIYRPGAQWLVGQPLKAQPLKEHGRYMLSLYKQGKLRHAGGFNDDSGGAAVFTAADDAAANEIVAADPAVASQVFAYDLHRWTWVDWAKLLAAGASLERQGTR